MKRNHIRTLGILITFTILTALFSNIYFDLEYIVLIIMLLSGVKFFLVAFQFMELKKANSFWKISFSAYLVLFIATILLII